MTFYYMYMILLAEKRNCTSSEFSKKKIKAHPITLIKLWTVGIDNYINEDKSEFDYIAWICGW